MQKAGAQGRELMPGRGRNRESWGILAEHQASRSLEQFLGKMRSSWRRGSRVTSSILSKLLPWGEGMCMGAAWGGRAGCQRGKERVLRGFPAGAAGRCCPTDVRKEFWNFRAMEQQNLAPRLKNQESPRSPGQPLPQA